MAFPDPTLPIATCSATSCTDCPVSAKVHCHFRLKDLVHFLLISFPGIIIGGAVINGYNQWFFALYIAFIIGFFGLLEIRVMCSHCPHYAEEGKTLTCWANHGSPKLWKYRPGPMSTPEQILFFGGLVVVWGYPLPFFALTDAWLLLALYILATTAFFVTLKLFLCSKCMNFACPLNGVDQSGRDMFFERNPSVAKHWHSQRSLCASECK
ncbi:hypothetical protein [Desulfopila sp. IMCC35008]|uniref:hypothetical protein n=1 Tax=Desulfopila sp. IMCC35008 TaxID=2653858 RepID=UPI0013D59441|nr:hypothetical protein [Desulfopila sp. IMCC35008]